MVEEKETEPNKGKENITDNELGVQGQYKSWFLDYASYVILERAVPALEDGLKPVQRRILHAMKEMDDGRFNKVANIIGQSMQYHPHGDASIADAIVHMGQKDLMIETQGNWGDVRTGDSAAAPRYIEARLSKFALEVAFNSKTTEWQLSYDGRKNEPVTLPMKFPLLLAHGAEGIAVGLSTKVLPHNFIEICDASIAYLEERPFELYPDFQAGGMIDVASYNDGKRGGRVKVRCRIEELDKKSLIIRDVPYGVTVAQLCESITKANELGKIKIKKLTEFTGKNVEIQVDLSPGINPDITIDALYAFTDCEVSISPNACVVHDNKPKFITVSELLTASVSQTRALLGQELSIKLAELNEKWHFTSLEKIFFEEKIYKELEEKHETWEVVITSIEEDFQLFQHLLMRQVTREDVLKLTEKPVRRIYKLDIQELNNQIKNIEEEIAQVKHHLAHLTLFTVDYFKRLKEKYGAGRERKTEVRTFDVIRAQQVAIANIKIYMNREEGFIGTSLKKDEFVVDCSEYDEIIVFTKSGKMKVVKVGEKVFVGKDIIHAAVFNKNDERTTYNMVYLEGASGISYAKRFNVTAITRDREYDLTKGAEKSKVHYLTSNPNGEAETIKVVLTAGSSAKQKDIEYDFSTLEIKGRASLGNIVTKFPIRTIRLKEAGKSTLAGRKLWYDDKFGRINNEEKGIFLGNFENDNVIVFYKEGDYEITQPELTIKFDINKILIIQKFVPTDVITAVYYDKERNQFLVKRFKVETSTLNNKFRFIKDGPGNKLVCVTTNPNPMLVAVLPPQKVGGSPTSSRFNLETLVEITGWKAIGAKLMEYNPNIELQWLKTEEEPSTQTELF